VVVDQADIGTIRDETTLLAERSILVTVEFGESPFLGDNNLLLSRELEGSTSGGLNNVLRYVVLATNGEDDLSNLDTSNNTVGLSEGTTHSSLKSISTSARKHFVDTDNVVWVNSHTHVEVFLGSHLCDVLVAANTGSFKSLAGQLFSLQRDKVDAERELISRGFLTTKIKDADLGVWHTTAVTRLRVRLVLAIPVASSRASSHGDSD